MHGTLGYKGSVIFVSLSDGRVIVTNDLWDGKPWGGGWVLSVPDGALTGVKLSTQVYQPKTKRDMSTLLSDLYEINHQSGEHLPFQDATPIHNFPSLEKIIVTHVKIGNNPIEVFQGPDQSTDEDIDPSKTSVFFLYYESSGFPPYSLQRGDEVVESYIYGFPEWTQGYVESNSNEDGSAVGEEEEDEDETSDFRDTCVDSIEDHHRENWFTPETGYYRTGRGESVYCLAGDRSDLKACNIDCGYCGRCPY